MDPRLFAVLVVGGAFALIGIGTAVGELVSDDEADAVPGIDIRKDDSLADVDVQEDDDADGDTAGDHDRTPGDDGTNWGNNTGDGDNTRGNDGTGGATTPATATTPAATTAPVVATTRSRWAEAAATRRHQLRHPPVHSAAAARTAARGQVVPVPPVASPRPGE